jgi:hypothetical protein
MGFRNFTNSFFIIIIFFVGINALIWFGWTREITDPLGNAGDLQRIGYVLGNVSPRQRTDDLPERHIKINQFNGQAVDLLTVGDSFSLGGGEGRNRHYQDYIASLQGLTVLNAPADAIGGADPATAPIKTLSKLISSGYLDVIKPKYLLLESVERFATQRLTKDYSLETTAAIEDVDRSFRDWKPHEMRISSKRSVFSFINNGNWKFIGNNLQYLFRDEAINSMVVVSRLNRRYFSSPIGNKLIFINEDVKNRKFVNSLSVAAANKNLNRLAALLKAKGITLVFMPIVDKLTLYEPYLQNQRYPRSVFFEELRKLPKDYLFIDTKEILTRSLEKGELDLYHQDDSHWTCKASETIFSTIRIADMSNAKE